MAYSDYVRSPLHPLLAVDHAENAPVFGRKLHFGRSAKASRPAGAIKRALDDPDIAMASR
jgi:hypothetical protein